MYNDTAINSQRCNTLGIVLKEDCIMNLRKLLCGLLALCLLLTMAPAALMEEAGIAGEGDLTLPTDLVQYSGKKGYSGSTYLALGESMTIEAADGYFIKSIASKNSRVASVDEDGAVEGLRVGKALISVTLGMDEYSTTVNCAVTRSRAARRRPSPTPRSRT